MGQRCRPQSFGEAQRCNPLCFLLTAAQYCCYSCSWASLTDQLVRNFQDSWGINTTKKFFFFKQKTAYEIASCLVGSEMCIRDSVSHIPRQVAGTPRLPSPLCKEHGVSAFLRRTAFFHSSTRVVQQGLVRRAIRPEYQDGIHSSIRFVQQIHNDEGRPRERSDRGRLFAFRQKSLFLAGRTSVGCQILKLRSFFCTSYVCLSVSLSV